MEVFFIYFHGQNKYFIYIDCSVRNNSILVLTDHLGGKEEWMASNPLFIIPDFFLYFPMNFAMATLSLKEMGKFLWEGREKSLPSWLSQFSSFKPKVAIAKFIGKMQKKVWYFEKRVGRHASFAPRRSVKFKF